jgi:hypothetical protein
MGNPQMKAGELLNKHVYCEELNVGKVIDLLLSMDDLEVTHLELELTKEASEQILGVTPSLFRPAKNTLAISALAEGSACCTERGLELKISKGQLSLYLRPA